MFDKTSLSARGYGIPKKHMNMNALRELIDELTVRPIDNAFVLGNKSTVEFCLFRESKSKIYIPKCYGLQKFGLPIENKMNEGSDISVEFQGTLRPEQKGPVEAYLKAAHNPLQGGGIINLSCAGGKTVIALYIIHLLAKKTLIVVHKNFLIDQWKERISQFLPGSRIGSIKGKVCDFENKDIVIASLQSLSMKDYEASVFIDFGFLIIDEIHRTGTEVFSQALLKHTFKYTLGLTATLERKDGLSKVFMWAIGDVVYKDKSRVDHVFVKCCTFTPEDTDMDYRQEDKLFNGKPNISRLITKMSEYEPRIKFIIDLIQKEYGENEKHGAEEKKGLKKRRFLVLSDRKNHLSLLKEFIHEKIGPIAGLYVGGMKENELQNSSQKEIILATYSFASEGFDVPGLDTLILATPKTNMEQIVGRILRDKPESRKNMPLVIDILDDSFTCFKNQFKKRRQYYKKCKFEFV